jgi:tripartite ATP-independent transporter DctM subunit
LHQGAPRVEEDEVIQTALVWRAGIRLANFVAKANLATHAISRTSCVLLEIIVCSALVSQLLVLVGDVLGRAFFSYYLPWTNDFAELTMMTLTFGGAALASIRGQHMRVHALRDRLPHGVQPYVNAFSDWVVVLGALAIATLSVSPLKRSWPNHTPVLHLSIGLINLPLTIGLVLIGVVTLGHLLSSSSPRTIAGSGAALAASCFALWLLHRLTGPQLGTQWPLAVECSLFLVVLSLGVPIALALANATLIYLYLTGVSGSIAVPLTMENGVTNSFVLLAVPFFILTGFLMSAGGVSSRLGKLLTMLLGGVRGGLHQVLIVAMFIFSGISGSKVADVVGVGSPLRGILADGGYERGESAGLIAAAAAAGETIPPSIAMIVLGTVTSVSISALFLAGLVPAALISLALMATVYVRARRRPAPGRDRLRWSEKTYALVGAIPALCLPVILVGGIVSGIGTPTEVSAVSVILTLLVSMALYREMNHRQLWSVMVDVGSTTGAILLLVSTAGSFAWALTLARVPQELGTLMTRIGSKPAFLLLTIVVLIVMGSVLEGLPAILIFGPLLVPVAVTLGINPLHFAIVFLIALGIGASAPPVGVVLYVAASVFRTTMEIAVRPTVLYLGVILAVLATLLTFVPFFTLELPRLAGYIP